MSVAQIDWLSCCLDSNASTCCTSHALHGLVQQLGLLREADWSYDVVAEKGTRHLVDVGGFSVVTNSRNLGKLARLSNPQAQDY